MLDMWTLYEGYAEDDHVPPKKKEYIILRDGMLALVLLPLCGGETMAFANVYYLQERRQQWCGDSVRR